jgi:hypothetical protein
VEVVDGAGPGECDAHGVLQAGCTCALVHAHSQPLAPGRSLAFILIPSASICNFRQTVLCSDHQVVASQGPTVSKKLRLIKRETHVYR